MSIESVAFRDALQDVFGQLDWLPAADGDIHRFHVPGDKSGSQNGWYVLYADGIASGAFGSWKAGTTATWCSREPADPCEAEQVRQRIAEARAKREAQQLRQQKDAADKCRRWWRDARRADPAHPYLVAKGVRPHSLRQRGDELLIPLYADGELVNLQRIAPDGSKRFVFGARVKGSYSPLGAFSPDRPLCICEGWATGATLHEDGGYTVAAGVNAGNLRSVATTLRRKYPSAQIIIAGDDDRLTDGNPGRAFANDAAAAAGALVTFPEWPPGAPETLTDFNDLAVWSKANGAA